LDEEDNEIKDNGNVAMSRRRMMENSILARNGVLYGKPELPECQASQMLAKHNAASNAEVCDVPELSLGCQDLEDLLPINS
jgi:hypothetical protein